MALFKDLALGCRVHSHDAARVYDAAHAGKKRVLEQRHSVTDYSNGRAMVSSGTASRLPRIMSVTIMKGIFKVVNFCLTDMKYTSENFSDHTYYRFKTKKKIG